MQPPKNGKKWVDKRKHANRATGGPPPASGPQYGLALMPELPAPWVLDAWYGTD